MTEKTALDNLTWVVLLYLWEATTPIKVSSSLCRDVREPFRAELAKALWRKADGITMYKDMLQQMEVPNEMS